MDFLINGQPRTLIPIKDFRAQHDLPPEFKVSLFEPKDYVGLGSIERAGTELNTVRRALLDSIPQNITSESLLSTVLPSLERLFEDQLYTINEQVGLKDAEIGFAVSGFSDVCRAWSYAYLRARIDKSGTPDFNVVYADWLNSSIRVSQTRHPYRAWQVQVLTHAYGRFGLIIHTATDTHYLYDPSLACPAEGYMLNLLSEVLQHISERLV
jgi:hypothetical protein